MARNYMSSAGFIGFNFILSSEDTNIPRRSYCWMASIADSDGNILDTFIGGLEYAAFYVK